MVCQRLPRKRKICIGIGICGLILIVSGSVLGPMVNYQVDGKLKEMMPLVNGTKTYTYWLDPPIPIDFQFYFFHVVNPREVVEEGLKPVVEERGPYTYRLIDKKENLKHCDDFTVSYDEREIFVFQRDLSIGDENDIFTTLNLPLITATSLISNEYAFIKEMTKLFFEITQDANLFLPLSVKDLIWGYTDPMMAAVKRIFDIFDLPFEDRFGFFYNLNNTITNNFSVFTGEDDLIKLSKFTKWNGVSELSFWTTHECNMLNGTDGNLFHPHISEEEQLYIFFPQVCRSFFLSFEERGEFKGVDYSRFVMKDEIFKNAADNPSNAGFCTPPHNCLPSGLLNATICRKGAPVIMSQPHFLGADQSIIDSIDGINPNRNLHETYIDLVPLTGTLVRTQRTTQINIFIKNTPYIRQTQKIKYLYFPVMFIKETAALTDDLAEEFRNELQIPLKVVFYTQYVCMGLGGGMILLCACWLLRIIRSEKVAKGIYGNIRVNDECTKLLSSEQDKNNVQ